MQDELTKTCYMCKAPKPLDEFNKHHGNKSGTQHHCRACQKHVHRKYAFGLSIEQFNNLLREQHNQCASCGDAFTEKVRPLVDHDHSCCNSRKSCGKCIRGLLCRVCNNVLGIAQDSAHRLSCAVTYLARKR